MTGTPVAAAQSDAGGADLSQAQNHSRGISRFLLRCAAATALLHTLQVTAQSVPAGSANQPIQMVIKVRLNGVAKGDFVAYMTADGDFLLPARELIGMGVPLPAGRTVDIGGELHLALKTIAGAELRFNERTLTLDLQLPPDMLPGQSLNLGATLPTTPIQRRAPGGFLNYRLGYTHTQSGFDSYNVTTELGLNIGEFLLLTQSHFQHPTDQQRAVGLQTQLIYDQPEALRRWVLSDSFFLFVRTRSSLNLGGINCRSSTRSIPTSSVAACAFASAVTLPSTVDIYMDGARVARRKLRPAISISRTSTLQRPGCATSRS